jgi:hypothetical protein
MPVDNYEHCIVEENPDVGNWGNSKCQLGADRRYYVDRVLSKSVRRI